MPPSSSKPSHIKIPVVKQPPQQDAMSLVQHSSGGVLNDVPEEGGLKTPTIAANSPYNNPTHHQAAASSSTFHASSPPAGSSPVNGSNGQPAQSATMSRKSSGGVRDRERLVREATESNSSLRKQALTPSKSSGSLAPPRESKRSSNDNPAKPRVRILPRLPHSKDVELAPTTCMYWSKAPAYGQMPTRGMRAHSATLVDHVVWLFGGCDEKGCWKDVYCFDTGGFTVL
jgi:Rab9 effector protein with kelch motifs